VSAYGRTREGQRASRDAHRRALANLELALAELCRSDSLKDQRALVADLRALAARLGAAEHVEIPETC
jgi:hypothetical protein